MPGKKLQWDVPRPGLIDLQDALAVIGDTVDIAVHALENLGEAGAARMLLHTVARPLSAQQASLARFVRRLAGIKRRAKSAQKGSRKIKQRSLVQSKGGRKTPKSRAGK